jgi:Protein of unknown function (DUF1566)
VLSTAYGGVRAANDALDAVIAVAQEIKDRGCVPTLSDVTVTGDAAKHINKVSKFLGRGLSLTKCKLFEDSTGNVMLTNSLYMGAMSPGLRISKTDKSFKFLVDGAYVLDGKLEVNATGGGSKITRLYTLTPDISASLPGDVGKTLSKLLVAEIFVNLKTIIAAQQIKAEFAYQIPGDFAIGVDGKFDSATKTWKLATHQLTDGKFVSQNTSDSASSLAITQLNAQIGAGIEVGYQVRLTADSPYIDTSGAEETWYAKWLNDARAGFSGEVHFFAAQRIGGGLMIDANIGTKVKDQAQCRLDLIPVIGYSTIFAFSARLGDQYYEDTIPDDVTNTLFASAANNFPATNLFATANGTFKKVDWCGATSKLGGILSGVNKSKILVVDNTTNKTLATTTYVFDNYLAPIASGNITAKSIVPKAVEPVARILADTSGGTRYTLEVDNTETEFDPSDSRWVYLWNTLNTDIVLTKTGTSKASFAVKCKNACDSTKAIVLSMIAPDGKRYVFPFYVDFDSSPNAAGLATYSGVGMTLNATASTDDVGITRYSWRSPSGLLRRTTSATLGLLSTDAFYQNVVAQGKVLLEVEDAQGQRSSAQINATQTVVAPVLTSMQPTQVVAGASTVFTITGTSLPNSHFDITFNGCVNIQFLTNTASQHTFSCTPQVGNLTAAIRIGSATNVIGSFNVAVTAAPVVCVLPQVLQAGVCVTPAINTGGIGLLNDTGITSCSDYAFGYSNSSTLGLSCALTADSQGDPIPPRQDASYGRDAKAAAGTLVKVGGGDGGFDFTKLDIAGNPLPASATSWACVKDNNTKLVWENKTTDGGLRDWNKTYTWYSSDSTTNGGVAGTNTTANNTQAYAAAVNATNLCGASDWRLPEQEELRSIVHNGRVSPSIDVAYFPNTQSNYFWSSSVVANDPSDAWFVYFSDGGYGYNSGKSVSYYVRLVRSGQ